MQGTYKSSSTFRDLGTKWWRVLHFSRLYPRVGNPQAHSVEVFTAYTDSSINGKENIHKLQPIVIIILFLYLFLCAASTAKWPITDTAKYNNKTKQSK
jgi:hypothetical protein